MPASTTISATEAQLYSFHNPTKIISGKKALEHLVLELEGHDAFRPMVVTHKAPGARGRLRRLLKAFRDSGMTLVVYDRLAVDAGPAALQALAGHFRTAGCDALLALGTGQLVVQAKLLRRLCQGSPDAAAQDAAGHGDAAHGDEGLPDSWADVPDLPEIPLFWLPTGPGDGDELGGEIELAGRRLRHVGLRPQLVCIDRRLLDPGDPEVLLDGVLVALVNAVEVCLNSGANPFAAAYAETAIRTLKDTLTPEGMAQSRAAIRLALTNIAVWAACARDMTPSGLAHRLGRAIAAAVPQPAGVCMALCLPAVVTQRLEREPRLCAELLHLLGDAELYSLTRPELRRSKCINLLREGWHALCDSWPTELPADLASTGLARTQMADIAATANPEDPRAALAVLKLNWSLIAPLQLLALAPEPANAPKQDADTDKDAAGIPTPPDQGGQDGPTELL
jgi:alcohol dehydrogenase class IV